MTLQQHLDRMRQFYFDQLKDGCTPEEAFANSLNELCELVIASKLSEPIFNEIADDMTRSFGRSIETGKSETEAFNNALKAYEEAL